LKERTELAKYLKEQGIMSVFHYVPLHSSPAGKLYGRTCGKLEITDRASDCLLRLPLYYEMNQEDVHSVVGNIKNFYKRF
jgi:dTDP-4-amino-4,6-dideoxygalactose transaminase